MHREFPCGWLSYLTKVVSDEVASFTRHWLLCVTAPGLTNQVCEAGLECPDPPATATTATGAVGSERSYLQEEETEYLCTSLRMCIITTLNHGLRNGGGIGDLLRVHSKENSLFVGRVVFDMLFFFIIIIIILNLIFGVIIDTFADLRSEKQQKEHTLVNNCFICGTLWLGFSTIYIYCI